MSTQGLEVENCERRDHSLAHPQKGKKLTWSLSVVPVWFRLNLTYPPQQGLKWAQVFLGLQGRCTLWTYGRKYHQLQTHRLPSRTAPSKAATPWSSPCSCLAAAAVAVQEPRRLPYHGSQPRRHTQLTISSPVSAECGCFPTTLKPKSPKEKKI